MRVSLRVNAVFAGGAMESISRHLSQTFITNVKAGGQLYLRRDRVLLLSRAASSNTKPQVSLPKLPVPTLQQTLNKYLLTVEPHLNKNEFENTKRLVNEFASTGGIGEQLQKLLLKKSQETENWLADWWLKYSYLAYRNPLIIFSSPGMVLPKFNCHGKDDVLKTAAKIITAALQYKHIVDNGSLPQEMMGKAPLDMVQHGLMLGTCRIPLDGCDMLTYLPQVNQPKHVIVAHNNHYFRLDVYDDNGHPYSESVLMDLLNDVINKSLTPNVPLGVLTAEHRDTWAKIYKEIRQNKNNSELLAEIQKSLFLICLDSPDLSNQDKNVLTRASLQLLHGNGSSINGGNRWYDKTVQFIVGFDGTLGISYEHSPAEGPPIANLSDVVVDAVSGKIIDLKFSSLTKSTRPPLQLHFELSNAVLQAIGEAEKNLNELVNNLEMSCFVFEPYGKNYIKSQKLSPDSFIQMALQLAFYRLHDVVGAAYETASTRMFIHGRTETIRSASNQSLLFCKVMLDPNATYEEKRKSINVAIGSHKQYVSEAVKGFGVDRHLLGLKLLAMENNMEIPSIFKDIGFERSSSYRLSTSQVAARHRSFMAYGPLATNGYGCCYNPRDDDMIFGISAFNECKETSAENLQKALHQSLVDMRNVLGSEQSSKL